MAVVANRLHYLHAILFPALWCWAVVAVAQPDITWERTIGGTGWEECQVVLPTNDLGYVFGGVTSTQTISGQVTEDGYGGNDMWLAKVDIAGNAIWDKRYGGDMNERVWDVINTSDGGYLLGGQSTSTSGTGNKSAAHFGGSDYWLVKVDSLGKYEWDQAFGGSGDDIMHSVHQDADGGYLLAGYSDSPGNTGNKTAAQIGGFDFWVLKVNVDATQILWQRTYGGSEREALLTMIGDPEGGYLLGGSSESGVGGDKSEPLRGLDDWWLVHISPTGNVDWERTLGGDLNEAPLDLIKTQDGGYLAVGYSRSDQSGDKQSAGNGDDDVWIMKLTAQGDLQWERSYGGTAEDWGYGVRQNGIGNYFVVGHSQSDPNFLPFGKHAEHYSARDFWVLYLDQGGVKIWEQTYSGASGPNREGNDLASKIVKAHDGGFVIGGHSNADANEIKSEDAYRADWQPDASDNLNDVWLIKTGCPVVQPDLISDSLICEAAPVTFNVEEFVCDECIATWEDGSNDAIRTVTPTETTRYYLTVTHANGCELEQDYRVVVNSSPSIEGIEVSQQPCVWDEPPSINLYDVQGGTPPFSVYRNDTLQPAEPFWPNIYPGEYHIYLEDQNGCWDDTTVVIGYTDDPRLEIGEDYDILLGDTVELLAVINNEVDSLYWEPAEQMSCNNCPEPVIQAFETIPVVAKAFSPNGCMVEDRLIIYVDKQRNVFAPTAFSPNGDGNNDYFTIYTDNSVRRVLSFHIYDRIGQRLYDNDNFVPGNEPDGWDGTLNGKPLNPQTFLWIAQVEYVDGERETISGDVTLLR